jgi:hypothetical protein
MDSANALLSCKSASWRTAEGGETIKNRQKWCGQGAQRTTRFWLFLLSEGGGCAFTLIDEVNGALGRR